MILNGSLQLGYKARKKVFLRFFFCAFNLRNTFFLSKIPESLSIGTFLHDGVDWIENGAYGANFLLKQRAYHNDGRTPFKKARKLTLKSSVVNKL